MTYRIAHFSDLHLGPLPYTWALPNFKLKRLLGGTTWALKRKHHFDFTVVTALKASIADAAPDHIAFTGDAVNIAAHKEFTRAAEFMHQLAEPENLSFVPGNHDAYVKVSPAKGLDHFAPFMQGDMRSEHAFPYVRLRRNIALIGLNCAAPRGLISSKGKLGQAQLERLETRLIELKSKGFCCIIMVHYPPFNGDGFSQNLRSLEDANELNSILVQHRVDLVIHGHNHREEFNWLGGIVPCLGVTSASIGMKGHHPAQWNLYEVARAPGKWEIRVTINRWQGEGFVSGPSFLLTPPRA